MRKGKFVITMVIVFIALTAFKTDNKKVYPFEKWQEDVKKKCNTADTLSYLTDVEKQAVFYLNMARVNPKLFAETYLQKYVDENDLKSSYVKSLFKDLRSAKSLPPLNCKTDLFKCAKEHAVTSGKQGKIGHQNYDKRFKKLAPGYEFTGENCSYGINEGLEIVIDLLIDEGESDLGHRRNILSKDFTYVGVSQQPHKVYDICLVMDFGG